MRAIPERLRGVITTMRYTNPRLPYLTCTSYDSYKCHSNAQECYLHNSHAEM